MLETAQRPVVATSRTRSRRRPWWLLGLAAATLLVLAYMLSAYLPPDIRTSRVPMHGDQVHFWLLVAHIGTAAVATVTGLVQFWPWLRRRCPLVHRWTGRVYFFGGVFPSMVLAVPVAALSVFGFGNMSGLFVVDLFWAVTAIAGYRAVRQGRYPDHRRWMIRNYAILLASLASRFWQVVAALIVVPQLHTAAYQGDQLAMVHDIASSSVWLALLPNLIIAECYIQRRYGVPARRPVRGPAAGRQPAVPTSHGRDATPTGSTRPAAATGPDGCTRSARGAVATSLNQPVGTMGTVERVGGTGQGIGAVATAQVGDVRATRRTMPIEARGRAGVS